MAYSSSVPFHGDTAQAFDLAESALTALGFRLAHHSPESLEAIGPGMNSTRESRLTGASRIHVRRLAGEIQIEAELGGVERMSRFVKLFPLGLCLTLAIIFSVLFSLLDEVGERVGRIVWIVPALVALPWLLLGPWMARLIRARTCNALDALLANMVTVGESAKR